MANIPNSTFIKQEEPSTPLQSQQKLLSLLPLKQDLGLVRSQTNLYQQQIPVQLNGINRLNLQQALKITSPFDGKVPIDVNYLKNLIFQNETMKSQISSLLAQRESLFQRIRLYEQQCSFKKDDGVAPSLQQQEDAKKKRFRRTAKYIARIFRCPVENCSKSYGSEGSLHQHVRLKHSEFDIISWIQSRITQNTGELSKVNSNESKLTVDSLSGFSLKCNKEITHNGNTPE